MSNEFGLSISEEQKLEIRDFLRRNEAAYGSALSFINFDKYKKLLGADWPEHRAIIFDIARKVITASIHKEHVSVEIGNGFVVIFAEEDGSESKELAAQIARRIEAALAAEPKLESLDIQCRAAEFQLEALSASLDLGDGKVAVETEQTKNSDLVSAKTSSVGQVGLSPGDASIIFEPVWNPAKDLLFGFQCQTGPGVSVDIVGDTKLLDLFLFEKASEWAYRLDKLDDPRRIIMFTNYEVARQHKNRSEYDHAIKQTPAHLLERIIPVLDGLFGTTPSATISLPYTLLTSQFPYHGLGYRSEIEKDTSSLNSDLRRTITHCTLKGLKRKQRALGGMVEALKWFHTNCRASGSRSYLTGIETEIEINAAQEAGIDLLGGLPITARVKRYQMPSGLPVI